MRHPSLSVMFSATVCPPSYLDVNLLLKLSMTPFAAARRRLKRFENPLILQLLWGGDNQDFILSLQEYHDELEFNWGDFSRAELEMFLRFLEAEEAEALIQVPLHPPPQPTHTHARTQLPESSVSLVWLHF